MASIWVRHDVNTKEFQVIVRPNAASGSRTKTPQTKTPGHKPPDKNSLDKKPPCQKSPEKTFFSEIL